MNENEFKALVEKRNDVDFEAFNLLREMQEDGVLTENALRAALLRDPDMTRKECEEMAAHYVKTFSDLSKRRQKLDDQIVKASVKVTS